MFPPSYNRDIYIKWHENEFEVGSNLLKSLKGTSKNRVKLQIIL